MRRLSGDGYPKIQYKNIGTIPMSNRIPSYLQTRQDCSDRLFPALRKYKIVLIQLTTGPLNGC